MIDALQISVPQTVNRRPGQWQLFKRRPAPRKSAYDTIIDCRPWLDVIIMHGHRRPTPAIRRHFNLEFKETRHLTAADILSWVRRLFELTESQAKDLRVGRIDFAADIAGVSVDWFRTNCRVRNKQTSKEYLVSEASRLGASTLMFGVRDDLIRIYNKVREMKDTGKDVLYLGKGLGRPEPIITRVERQCRGSKIPGQLRTLRGLFSNAPGYNPFADLDLAVAADVPDTDTWTDQRWLMSLGLQTAVERFGEKTVRGRLNRNGNANRYFSKYSDLLRAEAVGGITSEQLRRAYQLSTIRQLNQPEVDGDGQDRYPKGGLLMSL
jgi:hypothetical protein